VTESRKARLCGNEVPVCTSIQFVVSRGHTGLQDINTELMMCISNC